ncbi:hypothetical protein AXG93_2834s1020 [Marchantia polymorpha subsp. ruderalis]|uniref:Uncharacterized protein n=1 Tax=Marchantia polymorpha subsp. ruderalis TaxID=1480154 RepID=A0A176WHR5_MARPO|nr:hypothetical protein AXG93_2834s1020 [Marchantia polymorpha subsp. ruderalis]
MGTQCPSIPMSKWVGNGYGLRCMGGYKERPVLSNVVDEDGNVTTAKDSDSIKSIKGIMLPLFYSKFVLDDIHVMASLLNPIMKSCLVCLGVECNQIE